MLGFGRLVLAALVSLIPVTAAVAQPEITITLNGETIPDATPGNPQTVAFGSAPLGTVLSRTFTVTNLGTSNLALGSVVVGSDFLVTQQPSGTVTPGGSTTFTVRLNRNTSGTSNSGLSLANSDSNENPYNFGITATFTAPGPEVRVLLGGTEVSDGQAGVSFGSTAQGFPLVREFTISNIGSLPLQIGDVSVPNGYTVTQQPSNGAQPGASTTFSVRLNAVNTGTFQGVLSFVTNDSDENPFNISITGTVTEPAPEISVNRGGTDIADGGSFSFGTTATGFPISRVFTIENSGTASLTLGTVSVPTGFTVVSPPTSPVAIGESTTFEVRLDAAGTGSFSGSLSFNNNDTNENPFNFTVSGQVNAPAPEIVVTVDGANVNDGGSFAFGSTPQGAPVTRIFDILNDGTADLEIGTVTVPPGYTVLTLPSSPLTPGNSTELEIRLDAVTTGGFNGQVSIVTNDSNENPFNFQATGSVTPPAPEIAVSESGNNIVDNGTFGFGVTTRGFPVTKTFTIENIGSLELTVSNLKVPNGFTIVTPPPATIPAGNSGTFEVRFDATTNGARSGKLEFRNSDANEDPFNFQISAFANPPAPEIAVEQGGNNIADGGSFNFGTTTVGSAVPITFDVSNTGTADLKVKKVKVPGGFRVTAQPVSPVVPSGVTSFTVELTAARRGNYSGRLSFGNNDATEKPYDFIVSGVVNNLAALMQGPAGDEAPVAFGTRSALPQTGELVTVADLFDLSWTSALWRAVGGAGTAGGELGFDAGTSTLAADGWTFGLSHDFVATMGYRFDAEAIGPEGATIELAMVTRAGDRLGVPAEGAVLTLSHDGVNAELMAASVVRGQDACVLATDADDAGTLHVWYVADDDALYVSIIGAGDDSPVVIRDFRTRSGNAARVSLALRGSSKTGSAAVDAVAMTGSLREPMHGDVNLDGWVDSADAAMVLRWVGRRGADLTADLDRDGAVTARDLRAVLGGMSR